MREATEAAAAHAGEVRRGDRFEFGKNWQRFLDVLDDDRIAEAELSLREMLGADSLEGRNFLDVGSGSGLFSLAALRLGANRVHSFDFDPASVATTRELRRRYFADDPRWTIEQGSVLDADFVDGLGLWDVVYAWGVLHHTGAMWRAVELAASRVGEDGVLHLSLYNDQGRATHGWRLVKRVYNRLPRPLRTPFAAAVAAPRELAALGLAVVLGAPARYVRRWTEYRRSRGMSRWHDIVDWVGGYPFEVAKPEEVFEFLKARGFQLERLTTVAGRSGCNQYVFRRVDATAR